MDQLSLLIEDAGGPARAARTCGVHVSTVRRWMRGATPLPESAYRALYASSKWGRTGRDTDLLNRYRSALAERDALRRQVTALQGEVDRLLTIGDFGSANGPLYRPASA